MGTVIAQAFEGFVIFLLAYHCARSARLLGGIIYILFMAPAMLPKVGFLYAGIVFRMLRLSFLFNLIGILISSSGILLFPMILFYLVPSTASSHPALLGILFACIFVTMTIMDDAHLMETPDFASHFNSANLLMTIHRGRMTNAIAMRMVRSHFTDFVAMGLLMIVECYGISAFCCSALGFFDSGSTAIRSPIEGVSESLSLLKFVTGRQFQFGGSVATVINLFYGSCLLIYTVFFISLSSKLIDADIDEVVKKANEPR